MKMQLLTCVANCNMKSVVRFSAVITSSELQSTNILKFYISPAQRRLW